MLMHGKTPVAEIIIHCAATRPDWMAGEPLRAKVDEIRRWHMSPPNNWRDIGYHYVIDRDGLVARGRAETTVGAHVAGRNTGTIGVCLIGGHGSKPDDDFQQHFTVAQERALVALIADIRTRADIRVISGHNQYSSKACPGFRVPDWLPGAQAHFWANVVKPITGSKSPSNKPAPGLLTRILTMLKGR